MEESVTIDVEGLLPPKKHKKHKHKKHKKKKPEIELIIMDSTIKPKIVVASGESSNASQGSPIGTPVRGPDIVKVLQVGISPKPSSKKKKGKGRDSGTSSDEERWLDAIQSGKLEEVDDELKKIKPKDPKLMTARQRAMLERKGDAIPDPAAEQLLSLPSGYREKVMTPEMIKKAALKSQKRKQLLDEKREKDKKRTMERLLRKQENKAQKQNAKKNIRKLGVTVRCVKNIEGEQIILPPGLSFPLQAAVVGVPKAPLKCAIKNCSNIKRYSCSKTGIPLCSLQCYKKNLLRSSAIMS